MLREEGERERDGSTTQLELSWAQLSQDNELGVGLGSLPVTRWAGGLEGPMINVLIVGEEDIILAGYLHFLVISPPLNTSHLLLITGDTTQQLGKSVEKYIDLWGFICYFSMVW